jgi:hypothetical protein
VIPLVKLKKKISYILVIIPFQPNQTTTFITNSTITH